MQRGVSSSHTSAGCFWRSTRTSLRQARNWTSMTLLKMWPLLSRRDSTHGSRSSCASSSLDSSACCGVITSGMAIGWPVDWDTSLSCTAHGWSIPRLISTVTIPTTLPRILLRTHGCLCWPWVRAGTTGTTSTPSTTRPPSTALTHSSTPLSCSSTHGAC